MKAFPRPNTIHPDDLGMDLRDYFAAKAMQAMITTADAPCLNGLDGFEIYTAEKAYVIADAMMKAREK